MCGLTFSVSFLPVADFVRDYRDAGKFIEFCKQCGRYGNCWACPPFGFDADKYLSGYETAMIIGAEVFAGGMSVVAGNLETEEPWVDVIVEARKGIDERLLEMEKRYAGSRAFFAGTCHLCGECTRKSGKPCLYPDRVRPSLESLGFDLGKTASELLGIEMQWSENGSLPEYFTLVSGFFTNCKENDLEWK